MSTTEEKKIIQNMSLLGKKVGMTQIYNEQNQLVPVTVIEVGPCSVTQIKNKDTDGYTAIQIGFQSQKEKRLNKSQLGHFKKAGVNPVLHVKEFRTPDIDAVELGEILNASCFEEGQKVDIIGTTKGHGFQGVVDRYGFGGGPRTHGSMSHRRGGSYGQCQWPGRVYKGRKMPGHKGNKQRTVQNLEIVRILEEKNLILVKGSFPGPKGGLVTVRVAKKTKKK